MAISKIQLNRTSAFRNSVRFFETSGKDILFANKGRSKILSGVNKIADAVQVTLGPKGRNVAIDQSYGTCKITKDGVTVAKSIDLDNKMENMGCELIKKVASQTNDAAGDGTTTATILARALFSAGFKAVASGVNPVDIQRGITSASKHVSEILKKNAKKISDREISQVATISANNDPAIGQLITKAMKQVGTGGVISVDSGQKLEDELTVVKGMEFNSGMVNPIFMTDAKTQKAFYENPLILVTDQKISDIEGLAKILDEVCSKGHSLVIIADEIDGPALSLLVLNRLKSGLKCLPLKPPGFGDSRKETLEDIAISTGATFISKDRGLKLSEVDMSHLGSCQKIEASSSETLILKGGGKKEAISERVETLVGQIEANETSEYVVEKLRKRIGKLTDGVAVIKIGGGSEVEVNEKKDRVTDALNATRAAVEEGIVPGGGMALLYASNSLKDFKAKNADQQVGVEIVRKALRVPAQVICDNAGLEGAVVTGRLLEDSRGKTDVLTGMNALTGELCDMTKAGIIDPVKVTRSALSDASSISGVMITTEVVVCDKPKPPSPPATPQGMPGMGGMNGM